jgi:hypothetical protein
MAGAAEHGRAARLEGDTAAQVFNGVVVSYTDPLGQKRVAGPPAANWPGGVALADATDTTLVDTSTTNPATANGITRRWGGSTSASPPPTPARSSSAPSGSPSTRSRSAAAR